MNDATQMATLPATNGHGPISRAAVEALSERLQEPAWLREHRLAAFATYESLPLPNWSRGIGNWWVTDISEIKIEGLQVYGAPGGDTPPASGALAGADEHAGLIASRNGSTLSTWLRDDLAAKGVIYTDLATAVREHGDLVRQYLSTGVPLETDKFTALNAALWTGGTFLYVPRGVAVDLPLHGLVELDGTGGITLQHTLIIAEPASEVRLVDDFRSTGGDGLSPVRAKDGGPRAVYSGVLEVFLAPDSRVEYFTVENWGPEVYTFNQRRAAVGHNARMHWVFGLLGGRVNHSAVDTELAATGAETQTRGIYFTHGDQLFDLSTLTHHIGDHCTGDILFKGALRDTSRAGFAGMIRVEPTGQQTNSYLSDHILFLSDQAKADSVPGLEILANDVRCSHGATIGMIDEDQVFYLMSRGLERIESEKLIVGGFFEQVLQEMPLESMRELVRDQIQRKVELPKAAAVAR
ncbi:MAG TPA: Fe-S cluster assembly protein SufD [Chloroflexia bacterium]|nr:Fe-S cluster assembly protein SufD [Chloroflexia bacterium]